MFVTDYIEDLLFYLVQATRGRKSYIILGSVHILRNSPCLLIYQKLRFITRIRWLPTAIFPAAVSGTSLTFTV
jgi:hypothetical protein